MLTESLKRLTPSPRELLLEAAELYDEGENCVLLKAPTGYGKTTLSLAIYDAIRSGWDAGISLIHVLPLRSIGDDLYRKAVTRFYSVEPTGPSYIDIGVQHSYSPGAIALHRRFNITTLDTFILSFFKLPPFVLPKVIKDSSLGQYEVTRGLIYSSFLVFDEVHLYFQTPRSSSVFLSVLGALGKARVPVLMTSATVPADVQSAVISAYGQCRVIDRKPGDAPERHVRVRTIREEDVVREVKEALDSGKSVAVVRNTVKEAVEDFERLRTFAKEAILVHGRLSEEDRLKAIKKVLGGKLRPGTLVVATQVIEAGVDISADLMVTSAAPPESLEQRMGRVARYGGEGEFLVVEPGKSTAPYDRSEVEDGFMQAKAIEEGKQAKFHYPIRGLTPATEVSRFLEMIEENPMASSREVNGLLKEVCSFVREDELVTVYPRELLDSRCERTARGYKCDGLNRLAVPLQRDSIKGDTLNYLVDVGGGEYVVVQDRAPGENRCFFSFHLKVDGKDVQPLGVIVEGYKEGIGLVG